MLLLSVWPFVDGIVCVIAALLGIDKSVYYATVNLKMQTFQDSSMYKIDSVY